jgi:hypothetical protein
LDEHDDNWRKRGKTVSASSGWFAFCFASASQSLLLLLLLLVLLLLLLCWLLRLLLLLWLLLLRRRLHGCLARHRTTHSSTTIVDSFHVTPATPAMPTVSPEAPPSGSLPLSEV